MREGEFFSQELEKRKTCEEGKTDSQVYFPFRFNLISYLYSVTSFHPQIRLMRELVEKEENYFLPLSPSHQIQVNLFSNQQLQLVLLDPQQLVCDQSLFRKGVRLSLTD